MIRTTAFLPGILAALLWLAALPTAAGANPCAQTNPCAANNPCAAANPCAANPCGANPGNPCAANPCAANPCNPCAANPCGAKTDPGRFQKPAGVPAPQTSDPELLALGEKLWSDASLSAGGGVACATCHVDYSQMNASFAEPYPHAVAMPAQAAGVSAVSAAEMVQFCMITPMASEPLPWTSRELAALTAYVEHLQGGFAATNPCAGR